MTAKKVMAILAIALLMICPFIAVCGNDTEATDSDKSVLVSANNLNESQTYSLFTYDAFKMVRDVYFVKEFTHNPYTWTGHIYDFCIDAGARSTTNGNSHVDERATTISVKFTVTVTMTSDGSIAVTNIPSFLSGTGINEMKDIIGGSYKAGQEITLSGTVQQKILLRLEGDYYHNADLGYLAESGIIQTYTENIYDVTFAVKDGKTLNIKYNDKCNLYQKNVADYGKEYKDVKKDDAGKFKPSNGMDVRRAECNIDVTVNDSKQSTSVNADEFKNAVKKQAYDSKLFLENEKDTKATFVSTIDTEITTSSLSNINTNVAPTLDALKTATEGLGGKYSTQISDYTNVSDAIKKSVGGDSSSSNDDMWIWIAIAVVIILIIAALALWYFKFRTPPAQ